MSEIPFINALGDALDVVIADPKAPQADRPPRRLRVPRPRRRLALVFVGLALAGGAAAHTLLNSSQQLAAGYINCSYGTSDKASGVEGVIQTGLSPIAACQREYRRSGPAALTRPGVRFVACKQDANDVDVFVATGQPGQCQRLGYSPLPRTYAAAGQIHALERALGALQRGHDCLPPSVLVREVRNTLARLGFVGWRPAPILISSSGGRCGQFPGTDTQPSDPYLALQSSNRTVLIGRGPSLSIGRLIDRVEPKLISRSGAECLTAQTARAITRAAFASSPLRPRFATSAALKGQGFDGMRQQRYDYGCTVIVTTWPITNDRYVDVWLNARGARPLRFGQAGPPANTYKP
jgi:hypothetical protein